MNLPDLPPAKEALLPTRDRWMQWVQQLQIAATDAVVARVAIFDWADQSIVQSTASIPQLLGYAAEALEDLGPLGLAQLIHPDDLNPIADYYQRLMTLRRGEVVSVEYRMRRADGTWCWLRSQDTPVVITEAGYPLQVLGIVQDMTATVPSSFPNLTALAQVGDRSFA